MKKVYLGDSVYAHCDGFHIVLETENGLGPSNTIYLEPKVMENLKLYEASLQSEQPDEAEDFV